MEEIIVIGGGLAGSEAAWQIAKSGIKVLLYEMRPNQRTGAHVSPHLAELVCSNSLGSNLINRASGLLKEELRKLDSLLIKCADETSVPAGRALAVDRDKFAMLVTKMISDHPNIEIIRQEYKEIPDTTAVIASGPLTSEALSSAIGEFTGHEHLYFYDAISPIISFDSINMEIAFRGSRYQQDQVDGDYINCPLNQDEYDAFVSELINAKRIKLKSFELDLESGVQAGYHKFFEGCLPVEIIAKRGAYSLAYGPMRPVGLVDPRTGRRPYAVVQLRQDNLAGSLFNLVGFQTNLTFSEQRRILRMIPGLDKCQIVRHGQMHRNTFIHSPALLRPTLQFHDRDELFFAGQITGVEGYAGNIATGLLAGINAARYCHRLEPVVFPVTTMIGALCNYINQASPEDFQPMKANFGILPPLAPIKGKLNKIERNKKRSERSIRDLEDFCVKVGILAHQ
jgi:methylenetetrahydrofolate--tRNA-(uracil-5-)-methyltransferase